MSRPDTKYVAVGDADVARPDLARAHRPQLVRRSRMAERRRRPRLLSFARRRPSHV
jgi:hypothetical protein